ncbi:MAG TPA: hypothetical protein VIY86_12320, partial [Pirellulaceae bacterium]
EQVAPIANIVAHSGGALDVEFDRGGLLVSCGRDQLVKQWDANGQLLRTLPAFTDIVLDVDADASALHLVSADYTGQIRFWSLDPVTEVGTVAPFPARLEVRLAEVQRALETAESTFQVQTVAAATLRTALEAKRGEWRAAVLQLVAQRAELTALKTRAASAGDPPDTTAQESSLAELERRVGQWSADVQEQESAWSAAQTLVETAEKELPALRSRESFLRAQMAQFDKARADLAAAMLHAEEKVVDAEVQEVAARKSLEAARQDLEEFARIYGSPGPP